MRWFSVLLAIIFLFSSDLVEAASAGPLSCAQFRARLKSAGSAMGISVPAPIYEPAPLSKTDPMEQLNVVNYKNHEATLVCHKGGAFESFQIWGPFNGMGTEEDFYQSVDSINLISTAIYAYAGWSTEKINDLRTTIMSGTIDAIHKTNSAGKTMSHFGVDLPHAYALMEGGSGGFTFSIEANNER